MATPTYAELLDAAKAALLDVLSNGQHVGKDGRLYTKADLKDIQNQIDWLETKVVQQSSTSGNILDRGITAIPYRGA